MSRGGSAAESSGSDAPRRNATRQREAGAASRAETRRRLVVAAGELFAERGYAGSTVTAIAERAGVSLQTLYLAWGSKRQLLRAFMELRLSGSPSGVTDRTWADVARVRLQDSLPADADPQTYLRAVASFFRATAEHAALGWQLYRDAAAVDPEVREDQREFSRRRRATVAGVLDGLSSHALRIGMSRDDAIDTVMVIAGPESYDLLVVQTGYDLDQFEVWIARTLIAALLEPDT